MQMCCRVRMPLRHSPPHAGTDLSYPAAHPPCIPRRIHLQELFVLGQLPSHGCCRLRVLNLRQSRAHNSLWMGGLLMALVPSLQHSKHAAFKACSTNGHSGTLSLQHTGRTTHKIFSTQALQHTSLAAHKPRGTQALPHTGLAAHKPCRTQTLQHRGLVTFMHCQLSL